MLCITRYPFARKDEIEIQTPERTILLKVKQVKGMQVKLGFECDESVKV